MSAATELARDFARHVEATTEATRRGDSSGAHRGSKRVVTVGRRLLEEFGDAGADALVASRHFNKTERARRESNPRPSDSKGVEGALSGVTTACDPMTLDAFTSGNQQLADSKDSTGATV
jgi:hypothetical protein